MALPLLLLAPVLSPVQAEPAPLPASVRPLTEDQIVDVPGELVISFRSAEAPEDLDAVVASWELAGLAPGLRIEGVRELLQWQRRGRTDLTTVVLIDYAPEDLDLAPLREALSARADIEFATPNRVFVGDPREIDPNDPQYGSQYHHPLMQNDDAWNTTFGSASVIIGVTDDGVDIDHADLAPNVWTNTGEIPGDGIDNDGNGYVDDVNGWDFSGDNDDPRPNSSSNDHGTHCAGISAAKVNNSTGVAGTAGDCSIMALQFYLGGGSWTAAVIAETFAYGADNGARIMTTSYNMDGWAGDPVVTAGFDYMYDHGVLHFNSAGNGSSADPARQVFHQSMLVASTDSSDLKSGFSNWGTGIDVAAPGSSILSTITNGGYDTKSGTSMASPNAAGVAGLIWSAHPTWNRDQVAAQIYGTGDDIDGLNPAYAGGLGGGRVNSFRGVTETLAPPAIESVVGLLPDGSVLIDPSLDFTVRFDKILDPIAANDPLSTRIDYAGGDGVFGTADDQMITLNSTEYLIGSNEQRFTLGASLTTVGLHRVIIDAALLTDPFGTPIDANGDGIAGDSYVSTFEVCPLTELFTDPAESGAGWSVTSQNLSAGAWTPNPEVPVGGGARYDPAADYDGSGRCFLTQNGAGDTDVDGGPTRLVSRAFDVGGQPEALISFALWINATRTDDTVQLHISGDDGANWTLVETYTSFGGWQRILLRVADYVTPSANVRLRWSATDGGTPSILEAAVDDIRGFVVNCGGPGTVGVEVCTAAPNSSGQAASISGMGSSLVPDNDFTLTAAGCPPSQFGLFFSGRQLSGVFLGNGLLCIGGTLTRVSGALAVDGTGTAVLPLDLTSPAGAIDAVTGVTAYYQFWFRDSVGAGSNLSTALEVQWL